MGKREPINMNEKNSNAGLCFTFRRTVPTFFSRNLFLKATCRRSF